MLKYHLVKRRNPLKEGASLYCGQLNSPTPMSFEEVADQIAQESTLTSADIIAVLELLERKLVQVLLMGKSVRFGRLGSFHLTLRSKGVSAVDDWNADTDLKGLNLVYYRSSRIYNALNGGRLPLVYDKKADKEKGGEK